ncbi:MAG: hypothetical protein WAN03_20675 [Candidatus Sulfotelmatobacter sp.]
MPNTKTYFEQIPVAVVKKIAEVDLSDDPLNEDEFAVTTVPAIRVKPQRGPVLGRKGKGL